jgi:hypothetical protein
LLRGHAEIGNSQFRVAIPRRSTLFSMLVLMRSCSLCAHRLQWSPQKPERRALERDERAIERWKQKGWPRIKKNAARLGAHLVFAEESGFQLISNVAQTWAPQGQTPIHRHRQGKREKTSVISGIVSPKRHHLV